MNLSRLLALLIVLTSLAHCPWAAGQYYFQHVDQSTGLSSNVVSGICKDQDGFIWLATAEGLDRFDGGTVVSFNNDPGDSLSISDDYVLDICEDNEGRLWVGTLNGGVNVLDPATGKFKRFRHDPAIASSLAFEFNKLIFRDEEGDMWVNVHDRGIDMYDNNADGFLHFIPSDSIEGQVHRLLNSIQCYAPDTSRRHLIWLGSMAGVLSFDKNTGEWTHYPLEKDNSTTPSLVLGNEKIVRSMSFGPGGFLWLGTWGGGLCRLDTATGHFDVYKYEEVNPVHGARNSITRLLQKSSEEIWVCTENKGLAIFHTGSAEFEFLNHPETGNSPVPYPFDIIADTTGNLFVASMGGGLHFTNISAQIFLKRPLPYNLHHIGFIGQEDMFYASPTGSEDKLIYCDAQGEIIRKYKADPVIGDPLEWVFRILNYQDEVLLAGTKNLYVLDEKRGYITPHPSFFPEKVNQNNDHILEYMSVTVDRDQNIWLGTKFSGIFIFNPIHNNLVSYYQPEKSVNSILFSEFMQDLFLDHKGNIWYGAIDFGFFDPDRGSFVNLSSEDLQPKPEYAVSKIKCFAEDSEGKMWLGTQSNGVAVIIPGDTIKWVSAFNESNGLVSDMVRQVLIDRHDNAWIITYDGMSCIRKGSARVENYGEENGIRGLRMMTQAPDGSIYITAAGGFYHFSPEQVKPLPAWSRPYIQDVHTYTRPIPLLKANGSLQKISLSHQENNISVSFGMISYFKRNEIKLEYKLSGIDPEWLPAGKNLSVSYASIPPGNYEFLLRTSNGNEIGLPIFIHTPYWKTWWFVTLAVLFTSGMIYAGFITRSRQIRKQEEIRASYQRKLAEQEVKTLRSQMNPHFLFNSLNSIRYYVLNNENENAADYITRFSRLLRLILQNSRSDQISLKDELHALRLYVEFEQMRFNRKFEFYIEVASDINTESIYLQPLTIQPFVENAIWHGLMPLEKEGRLNVSVVVESHDLVITVLDNGIGRERSARSRAPNPSIIKSYGLDITRERMNLYQTLRGKRSEFAIEDLYDKSGQPAGTKVRIVIEL